MSALLRLLLLSLLLTPGLVLGQESSSWTPDGRPVPPGVTSHETDPPEGYVYVGDMLVRDAFERSTVWESALWPDGRVPYTFVEDTAELSWTYTKEVFGFASSPPRITVVPGEFDFLASVFRVGQLLVVSGSQSNDNDDMSLYQIRYITETELHLDITDAIVDEAPGATVSIGASVATSLFQQDRMLEAMALWEEVANIEFVPWAGESQHVVISNSLGNSAIVGRTDGTISNTVKIFNWDYPMIVCHELAHTLGEYHEQSRPDRDEFVTINWGAISQDACGGLPCDRNFFEQTDAPYYPAGPWKAIYDFESIMHYDDYSFSICRPSQVPETCPDSLTTIDCNPDYAEYQHVIGQREAMSFWDRTTMSYLYPQLNWTFLHGDSPAAPSVGTFQNPYTDFDFALSTVPTNGKLVILYPEAIDVAPSTSRVFTKPMVFEAPTGEVELR